MNHLVAKGFKQGGKASITSAVQSTMRIGYAPTLGPQFSLLLLFTDICHLLEYVSVPARFSTSLEKQLKAHAQQTWDGHKACFLSSKAGTLWGSLLQKLWHPCRARVQHRSLAPGKYFSQTRGKREESMRSSLQNNDRYFKQNYHFPKWQIIVLSFLETYGLPVREGQEIEVITLTFYLPTYSPTHQPIHMG